MQEQTDLVDFLFVVGLDILWNYDMPNARFQESTDWKLWCMFIFMNSDLLFPAFVSSLFSIKHFQAKGQNLVQWKPLNRASVYRANRLLSSFG